MATFHDRTLAPKFQGRLLRGAGTVPCRVLTDAETIAAIEADIGSADRCSGYRDACHGDTPNRLPAPGALPGFGDLNDIGNSDSVGASYPGHIGVAENHPADSRLVAQPLPSLTSAFSRRRAIFGGFNG